MYYGDSFADLATMRLEGKIKNIYAQAYREIEEKLNTFLAKSVIKEKEYEAKVQAGKLSQEWFDRWKSGQVFIGKRWRDLRQNIAHEIYNSRKSATDMINGERKAVFQDNVNYTQYSIDKDHNFGISFTLYDNATVTRLISEDPDLVPDIKYPDPSIDYAWSKKQITSAITQGILQGESIPELAKRVGKKLQSSNEKSMVRCARTAMTGAQNSGRIQAMHNAQGMGIEVEKLWIATLDNRTRDSHRDLDGQLAKVDEPFHSLLGDIMFPGDPNAAPANVWNCFVGNTKVASDSEIIRSYKHDYSGELITVKTASGVEFTCTPNHPILTDRGWIGAKFLNNGDRLAETRCIKSDFLGVDPDIDHTLSCFDTIHKFFEKVGIKRTCSLGVNFHGDIPTTDVEIVSKERLLRNYGDSCEFQSKNKLGFKFTTPFVFSKGHFMSGFRRVHVSFLSLVSRMRQTLSFFLARISHSGIHGLGKVSNMDSCILESKCNSVSGNVQFIGESLAGLSSRVFFDNIVDIKISSVSHVPVYNLQTQNGYYFVSSDSSIKSDSEKINGIFVIAHNCRCSLGWNYPKYSNQYDTRAARDVDWEDGGQTEQIPYMTYKEWAKWKKTGQLPQRGLAIIETQNNAEEQIKAVKENAPKRPAFEDYTKKLKASMDEQDYEAFKNNVENSDARILYEKYADECKAIIRTKDGGKYTPEDTVIYDYNSNGRHRYSTLAHEMGHMFDVHIKRGNSSLTFNETDLMNKSCNARITVCPSNSDQFLSAIRKDKTDSLSGILNNIKEKVKLLKYGDASGGVQDALDGFFSTQKNRQFKWGHGERYYNRNYNYVDKIGKSKDVQKAYSELGFGKLTKEEAKREFRIFDTAFETWANVISAITNGGDELKAFEEFMPETVKTAREIIKGIE